MKNITFKLLTVAIILLGSINVNAQYTFTYSSNGGWILPPGTNPNAGSSSACPATVTVTWTSTPVSGGLPTGHILSHTFNINETYTFQVLVAINTNIGNFYYSFSVPCQGSTYGPISKTAVGSNPSQPYFALPTNNQGDGQLSITPVVSNEFGLQFLTGYNFSFQPPVGVGG